MRTEDIRSENEKYYCCKDYIWSIEKASMYISLAAVLVMMTISLLINRLLLKKQFLIEAASQELGYEDVMHWVDTRMSGFISDRMSAVIILFNVIIIVVIWLRKWLKSYDLYKYWWIRIIPVILYLIEFFFILIYYHFANVFPELLILIINLAPVLLTSRLLYPLESRPNYEGILGKLSFVFDILSKIVIDRI